MGRFENFYKVTDVWEIGDYVIKRGESTFEGDYGAVRYSGSFKGKEDIYVFQSLEAAMLQAIALKNNTHGAIRYAGKLLDVEDLNF